MVFLIVPLSAESVRQREQANLKNALDWVRDVVMYRHAELAPKFMAGSFVEHSPVLPQGRAGFILGLGQTSEPLQKTYKYPLITVIAKGDMVLLAFERTASYRGNPSKKYTYTWFDVLRFKNNMITDHWDAAVRNPPPPYPPAIIPGTTDHSMEPVLADAFKHETDTPVDLKNAQVALDWFRVLIGYRNLDRGADLTAAEFKQHNPNIAPGRDSFAKTFGGRPPEALKPGIAVPPMQVFSKNGLVAMMFERESPDPENVGSTYKHYHFDMVKVADGKIAEHWDESKVRE